MTYGIKKIWQVFDSWAVDLWVKTEKIFLSGMKIVMQRQKGGGLRAALMKKRVLLCFLNLFLAGILVILFIYLLFFVVPSVNWLSFTVLPTQLTDLSPLCSVHFKPNVQRTWLHWLSKCQIGCAVPQTWRNIFAQRFHSHRYFFFFFNGFFSSSVLKTVSPISVSAWSGSSQYQ